MKRRTFLENFLKLGGAAAMMALFPTAAYSRRLDELFDEADSLAYAFDVDSDVLQKRLESEALATAIRGMVFDLGEGKKVWFKGEGRNNRRDSSLSRFSHPRLRQRCEGFTPVTILKGKDHNVYWQFVEAVIGRIGIIRGFDGNYHCVYPDFEPVFGAKYQCYGLPANSYKVKSCRHCGESYIEQDFQLKSGASRHQLYSWAWGCRATGGNHDDLKLEKVEPCGAVDNLRLGVKF